MSNTSKHKYQASLIYSCKKKKKNPQYIIPQINAILFNIHISLHEIIVNNIDSRGKEKITQ